MIRRKERLERYKKLLPKYEKILEELPDIQEESNYIIVSKLKIPSYIKLLINFQKDHNGNINNLKIQICQVPERKTRSVTAGAFLNTPLPFVIE